MVVVVVTSKYCSNTDCFSCVFVVMLRLSVVVVCCGCVLWLCVVAVWS